MSLAFANYELWAWRPHVEVWVLVLAALGLGFYVKKVLAPAVRGSPAPITRRQKYLYFLAVGFLWLASDWPMHDISEEYLYSVHMIQHLLITLVVPPLLLLSTPGWLAERVVNLEKPWVKRLLRPIVVGVVFNAVVALSHLPWVVNTSAANGPLHYAVHLALFVTALAMWLPVCGPLPSLLLKPFSKMFYLFAMSILPTVPAGFLTFAQGVLYEAYDTNVRFWGLDAAADQQTAGLIMKIVGGSYLWLIIACVFFRCSARKQGRGSSPEQSPASFPEDETEEVLSYAQVQEAFKEAGAPPIEAGAPPVESAN